MAQIITLSVNDLIPAPVLLTSGFDEKALETLMGSIPQVGLTDRVKVYPTVGGQYMYLDGNHRVEAHRRLGLDNIDCILEDTTAEELTDEEILMGQMLPNSARRNTSSKDFGQAVAKLISEYKVSVQKIAETLGVGKDKVYAWLSALKMTEASRNALENGTLTLANANILGSVTSRLAPELLEEAEANALTMTETEFNDYVKSILKSATGTKKSNEFEPTIKMLKQGAVEALLNSYRSSGDSKAVEVLEIVLGLDPKTVSEQKRVWDEKQLERQAKLAQKATQSEAEKIKKLEEEIEAKKAKLEALKAN